MGESTGKPLRVLIVDDSDDDALLILRELRRGGYEPAHQRVDTASALETALDAQPWDVILSDYTMPSFSGAEALAQVRARGDDVPFLFVSGTIGEEFAVSAVRAGANDYILKKSLKRLPLAVDRELSDAESRRGYARVKDDYRASEARFRNILRLAADAVILVDEAHRIMVFNQGAETIFGYTAAEATGQLMDVLLPERYAAVHRRYLQDLALAPEMSQRMGHRGELYGRRKDGSEFPVETSVSKLIENGRIAFTIILRDVTERKEAEERMHFLAHFDALTVLPNRVLFQDRLTQNAINASRHNRIVGVMFIDLDRFKPINDTLGHAVGDLLLKAVADRLISCVREGDTVARLGGDEFAIILADMAQPDDAAGLARKILSEFSRPFAAGSHALSITASIGITLYPTDDERVDRLLENADAAMYRAKELGKNAYQFYTAEMNVAAVARLDVEQHLRHALERREFVLHYQPLVDLATRRIIGVEALIRWMRADRGMVPPAEFIPVAEDMGLINVIGEWVLHAACTQAKIWLDAGLAPMRVAINVSATQFRRPDFAAAVTRALSETGLPPRWLALDLTEHLLMAPDQAVTDHLASLHADGISISIDDFGTGYSSLANIKRFPIDALKIDRTFVRDLPEGADHAAIAGAIVSIARDLTLRVVAEGVETEAQAMFLRAIGCDAAQGFLFSRPLPADAIEPHLMVGRIRGPMP
ncbi:MAG: EAL domain-containing response regulator [Nitrospirota bacterium]